jgi:hypothetical protein
MSNWSRNKDITNYSKKEIIEVLKTNPILTGHTYTAKQFFETDYEYDLTNCDLVGKPNIEKLSEIQDWDDVQIKDQNGEIQFLVHPDIYKCCDYTVHMRNKRLERL